MIERIEMKTRSSRMRSQTESPDVQTVPFKTCLCQDRPRRNVLKSRFSSVQNYLCVLRAFKRPYDQTFVRSKPKFVRSKFENLCVHLQIIVRSKTPMPRLSCAQKFSCVLRAFISASVQTFVRSCPYLLPVLIILVVHNIFIMYSFQL